VFHDGQISLDAWRSISDGVDWQRKDIAIWSYVFRTLYCVVDEEILYLHYAAERRKYRIMSLHLTGVKQ
jgi:hypothetical protein